jgi:hypothetical protein
MAQMVHAKVLLGSGRESSEVIADELAKVPECDMPLGMLNS